MSTTKIEWCEKSWNPWTGCSPISAGCVNCYAEQWAKRLAGRFGYPKDKPFAVTSHRDRLYEPWKWKKKPKKPLRIFVCSMGDLFHPDIPFHSINEVFAVMDGNAAVFEPPFKICDMSIHTFIVLTKRAGRMLEYDRYRERMGMKWPSHVWPAVTVEKQKYTWRIDLLLKVRARMFMISGEPMLGSLDLKPWLTGPKKISQVVVGGETGRGARPMHPEWPRKVRDDCIETGTPFLFKRWGKYFPAGATTVPGLFVYEDGFTSERYISRDPDMCYMTPCYFRGERRLLDGQKWEQWADGHVGNNTEV